MSDQSQLIDAMQALASSNAGKMDFRGKLYTPVAVRVERLREAYADQCAIYTELVHRDQESVVMRSEVWAIVNEDWVKLSTGFAEEARSSKGVNSTSALENCETSAVGRALAALGLGGGEYASADELTHAVEEQTAQGKRVETLKTTMQRDDIKKAVECIREGIDNGDYAAASAIWFKLDDADKQALWVAPTKVPEGVQAPFTTKQREVMKTSEFRQAKAGTDQPENQ